jgi:hypothetical protein
VDLVAGVDRALHEEPRRLLGLEGAHLQHALLDEADDPRDRGGLCHTEDTAARPTDGQSRAGMVKP